MRKLSLVLITAALCFFSNISAGVQDFTLVNHTGYVITHVFVSPSASDNWGDDIMDVDVLALGESVDLQFSLEEDECMWDIKVIDEDGDEIIWTDIDLCQYSKITIFYGDDGPTAELE